MQRLWYEGRRSSLSSRLARCPFGFSHRSVGGRTSRLLHCQLKQVFIYKNPCGASLQGIQHILPLFPSFFTVGLVSALISVFLAIMKLCFLLSFVLAGLVSATHFKRVVHHHHHGLNRPQHQSSECHHSPTMTSTSGKPTNHPAMLKTNLEGAESTIEVAEEALVVFTPNRIKAGIAGGDSYAFMKDHIGWWYDW